MAILTAEMGYEGPIKFSIKVLPCDDVEDYCVQVWVNEREIVCTYVSVSESLLGHTEFYFLAQGFLNSADLIDDYSKVVLRSRNASGEGYQLRTCINLKCDHFGVFLEGMTRGKKGALVNMVRVTIFVYDKHVSDKLEAEGSPYPATFRWFQGDCPLVVAEEFGRNLLAELDAALIDRSKRREPSVFDEFEDPEGYYQPD